MIYPRTKTSNIELCTVFEYKTKEWCLDTRFREEAMNSGVQTPLFLLILKLTISPPQSQQYNGKTKAPLTRGLCKTRLSLF
jgi:hypothetical protein